MSDNNISENVTSFLKTLFDFQFNDFITTRVIRILYVISVALAALGALLAVISGVTTGGVLGGLAALIITPVLFIFYVLVSRVSLELILVVFRISSDVRKIADGKSDSNGIHSGE